MLTWRASKLEADLAATIFRFGSPLPGLLAGERRSVLNDAGVASTRKLFVMSTGAANKE